MRWSRRLPVTIAGDADVNSATSNSRITEGILVTSEEQTWSDSLSASAAQAGVPKPSLPPA